VSKSALKYTSAAKSKKMKLIILSSKYASSSSSFTGFYNALAGFSLLIQVSTLVFAIHS
jgi:hypothetical protein